LGDFGNMRGHNRKKPLAIVRLEGNPGKRRLPSADEEVVAVTGAPACPDWMNDTAQEEWAWAIPLLNAQGTLAQVDKGIIAGYCYCYSMAAKYGQSEDKQDQRLAKDYLKEMKGFASLLGMSPSDRARLLIAGKKSKNEFSEFVGQG
jgi:P27 family predicted phage terminase small subunit